MSLITTIEKPIFYAVKDGANTIISDVTNVGDATGIRSSYSVVSDSNQNTFLGAMLGSATGYNPLPDTGFQCESGVTYSYGDDLIICRQTHSRTVNAPVDIPALFLVYRADAGEAPLWVANESVLVGQERIYSDVMYVCIQAHITVDGLTPDITPALWNVVSQSEEWTVGVAYAVDDIVTYDGNQYTCLQAHTSIAPWYPTAVGIINVLWVFV